MTRRGWVLIAVGSCILTWLAAPAAARSSGAQARAAQTFPVTPYYRWIPKRDCKQAPQRQVAPDITALLLPTKRLRIPAQGKSVTATWTADLPGPCLHASKSCGYNIQAGAPQAPRNVSVTTQCLGPPNARYDCVPIPNASMPRICRVKFTITLTGR